MASAVQIANMALRHVGAEPIISLDDDSKEAASCKLFYEPDRDAVLREHPEGWSFAIHRQALSAAEVTNLTGYTYAYPLPTDPYCLRVLELIDFPYTDYVLEGRYLYTNLQSVKLKYVRRVTDPNLFDSSFTKLLALRMGMDISVSLFGKRMTELETLYERELSMAIGNDLAERPKSTPKETWSKARFS